MSLVLQNLLKYARMCVVPSKRVFLLVINEIMDIAILAALWGSFLRTVDAPQAPKEEPAQVETLKEEYSVVKHYVVEVTGYSSREEETDDTPHITASGSTVDWGIVATNRYPFETLLRFPDTYGDKVFVVKDRMNSRYKNRMDIWFPHYEQARRFGIKNLRVEIIEKSAARELAQK